MRPSVVVLGDDVIAHGFSLVARNVSDLSGAWDAIGDTLTDMIAQQFDSQGAEFGTSWDPLAEGTVEAKRRAGYSEPTKALVATGAMAGSAEVHVSDDGLEITMDSKVAFHHGERRATNVPRRPVFEITHAVEAYVMVTLQHEVFDGATDRWRHGTTGGLRM